MVQVQDLWFTEIQFKHNENQMQRTWEIKWTVGLYGNYLFAVLITELEG